jgi:hypothetical protein
MFSIKKVDLNKVKQTGFNTRIEFDNFIKDNNITKSKDETEPQFLKKVKQTRILLKKTKAEEKNIIEGKAHVYRVLDEIGYNKYNEANEQILIKDKYPEIDNFKSEITSIYASKIFDEFHKIYDEGTKQINIIMEIYGNKIYMKKPKEIKIRKNMTKKQKEDAIYYNENVFEKELDTYEEGKSGYIPDIEFKKIYARINLTEYSNKMGTKEKGKFKRYKTAIISIIYRQIGLLLSSIDENDEITMLTVKFKRLKTLEAKQYDNIVLKDGVYNCVINAIKEQLNDPTKLKILDELNDKFLSRGIDLKIDIYELCRKINIEIQLYDKSNILRGVYKTKDKNKIIKIRLLNLGHAETFYNIDKDKLNIIYVDNLEEISKSLTEYYIIKCKDFNKINCLYTKNTMYKLLEMENNDYEKPFITTLFDAVNYKFELDNNINNDYIYSNSNEGLYIKNSCHQPNMILFKENARTNEIKKIVRRNITNSLSIDDFEDVEEIETEIILNDCVSIDRNKHYASYKNNEYYKKYKFPSNKLNYYHIKNISEEYKRKLILKTGFIQINNIIVNNKSIEKLQYFRNKYIYPSFIIKWAFDYDILKCDFVSCAFSEFTKDIILTDEIIEEKHYNKIFGLWEHSGENKQYWIKCSSIEEAEDLKFYNESIDIYDETNNMLLIKEEIQNPKFKGHLSSYILGYATIEIMDKMRQIEFSEIIGVHCDNIILKTDKYLHLFNLSSNNGDWKIENKHNKICYDEYSYINPKSDEIYNFISTLSEDKINYGKLNLISGGAGAGKTTRFLYEFENSDERLYKFKLLMPNHNLIQNFKSKCEGVNIGTYQMFLSDATKCLINENSYNNIILDEATMIGKTEMTQIINICEKFKICLFIVGDYDLENMKSFQIKPIKDIEFFECIRDKTYYYKHLTKNYRQNGDLEFSNFLNSIRGKTNLEIQKIIRSNKQIKKITYNNMLSEFDNKDIIITCYSEAGDKIELTSNKINDTIYKKAKDTDLIKCCFNTTTKEGAKNSFITLVKKYIDFDKVSISCANTSHIVQGLEFENNIYIIDYKYFVENQLYVMLSRAKNYSQLKIISIN